MKEYNTCVVCESGWILIGVADISNSDNDILTLKESSVVRHWDNGRGIGGIAKEEYKDEYVLDPIGTVEIKQNKILFMIPCEW